MLKRIFLGAAFILALGLNNPGETAPKQENIDATVCYAKEATYRAKKDFPETNTYSPAEFRMRLQCNNGKKYYLLRNGLYAETLSERIKEHVQETGNLQFVLDWNKRSPPCGWIGEYCKE